MAYEKDNEQKQNESPPPPETDTRDLVKDSGSDGRESKEPQKSTPDK